MKKVKLTTTLELLRANGACADGYRKLAKSLGAEWPKDKPINLLRVLEYNGVQDMLWCLRATEQDCVRVRVGMAAMFAKSVLKHYTAAYPYDTRVADCIDVCLRFAQGKSTQEDLDAAGDAAWDAERKKQAAIIRKCLK